MPSMLDSACVLAQISALSSGIPARVKAILMVAFISSNGILVIVSQYYGKNNGSFSLVNSRKTAEIPFDNVIFQDLDFGRASSFKFIKLRVHIFNDPTISPPSSNHEKFLHHWVDCLGLMQPKQTIIAIGQRQNSMG